MDIDRKALDSAVQRGIIDDGQASALWAYLQNEAREQPQFVLGHLLYYLGGLIAIGGISFFVTLAWEALGGIGLFMVAAAIMAFAAWLTHYFIGTLKLTIPAGLMAALVVAAAPLAIYGLQRASGLWDGPGYRHYHTLIDGRWIVMELATLAVGAAVLWRWRLPFSVMPVAGTLWYMSMDLAPLLQSLFWGARPDGQSPAEQAAYFRAAWEFRKLVSVAFGMALIAFAIVVDRRTKSVRDYGFWLHLAGAMAFWGGLTSMTGSTELGRLAYCGINLALMLLGVALDRRVYAVLGAMGVFFYLGHLSYKVFKESLLFPVMLIALGLGVVWLGVLWQRHEAAIGAALRRHLPGWLVAR